MTSFPPAYVDQSGTDLFFLGHFEMKTDCLSYPTVWKAVWPSFLASKKSFENVLPTAHLIPEEFP